MKNILLLFVLTTLTLSIKAQEKKYKVLASCGQCQFKMNSQQGCDLAIKYAGKTYWVDATTIDDHGDSHADDGFCNAVRKAEVTGIFEKDRFVATSFTLLPQKIKKAPKLGTKNPNSKYTNCMLVEKSFINKGGKITDYTELYLQCSIQDYFIKICDSKVSLEELKKYLNKGISVDMEIKEGMWDHCSDDPAYAQSRMGTYVVINKIID